MGVPGLAVGGIPAYNAALLRSQRSHGAICPVDTAPRGESRPPGRSYVWPPTSHKGQDVNFAAHPRNPRNPRRYWPQGLRNRPPGPARRERPTDRGVFGVSVPKRWEDIDRSGPESARRWGEFQAPVYGSGVGSVTKTPGRYIARTTCSKAHRFTAPLPQKSVLSVMTLSIRSSPGRYVTGHPNGPQSCP